MARRRPGINLITAMLIVALAGIVFAWATTERRKRIVVLTAEYQRLGDRAQWAEKMHKLSYISKNQLKADQDSFGEVKSKLELLGAAPQAQGPRAK